MHEGFPDSAEKTAIDLNRTGVPLIEIVSEPDIATPDEAYEYLTRLKEIILYTGVSDCNMEEGSLRCDANVSVRPRGQKELGTKAEIKNVNSFRFIREALVYEIERQIEVIEGGGKIVQETRLYNSHEGKTYSMRSKEQAHDYRYFPEPDLLPLSGRAAGPPTPAPRRWPTPPPGRPTTPGPASGCGRSRGGRRARARRARRRARCPASRWPAGRRAHCAGPRELQPLGQGGGDPNEQLAAERLVGGDVIDLDGRAQRRLDRAQIERQAAAEGEERVQLTPENDPGLAGDERRRAPASGPGSARGWEVGASPTAPGGIGPDGRSRPGRSSRRRGRRARGLGDLPHEVRATRHVASAHRRHDRGEQSNP